jgi:hypothetical protein
MENIDYISINDSPLIAYDLSLTLNAEFGRRRDLRFRAEEKFPYCL